MPSLLLAPSRVAPAERKQQQQACSAWHEQQSSSVQRSDASVWLFPPPAPAHLLLHPAASAAS
jgi:hypothetical protein